MESCDGENDPQYEHFLSKLKEHHKSYVLEAESHGVPRLIKYEAETGLDCESNQQCGLVQNVIHQYQRRRKGRGNNEPYHDDDDRVEKEENEVDVEELIEIGKEQFYLKTTSPRRNDRIKEKLSHKDHFYLKSSGSNDPSQIVEKAKVQNHRKMKKRARYANGDHEIITKRAMVQIDGKKLCRLLSPNKNDRLIEYQSEYSDQVHQVGGKNKVRVLVKTENENYKDLGVSRVELGREGAVHGQTELMKVEPLDSAGISSKKKTVFGDHCLEREGIHSQTRTLKCSECSITFNISDGKHQELDEGDDDDHGDMVSEEVEILDIAAFGEKGIACPFVSSKKFHRSMVEDEFPEAVDVESDEFREEVLRVLEKPFDKEEYRKYREKIKVGSYLDHHSDLKRKLKKYRYKQGKCLVVLRGFFFWLQNLTREGSFEPWTDQECLAVEPPPAP